MSTTCDDNNKIRYVTNVTQRARYRQAKSPSSAKKEYVSTSSSDEDKKYDKTGRKVKKCSSGKPLYDD
jgi:hypothetical protein